MVFQEDLNSWLPNTKNPPTDLDLEMARFMLAQVGDQFCDLLTQEAEAINIHISEGKLSKKNTTMLVRRRFLFPSRRCQCEKRTKIALFFT